MGELIERRRVNAQFQVLKIQLKLEEKWQKFQSLSAITTKSKKYVIIEKV